MFKKWLLFAIIILLPGEYAMAFTLTTSAWESNGSIPKQYTCDGTNISPSLTWHNPPVGTKSFILIMDDPDAPAGTWTHWVLFNIPADIHSFPENLHQLPQGTLSVKNSAGHARYDGPCPPDREHRYFFNLYALNTQLEPKAGEDLKTLRNAMHGHVIGNARLEGRYNRKR
ncbi:MAG: YbhB/YbcL family Raf kinase inhibitor-like protein [Gammaproteobacteria bacterium]